MLGLPRRHALDVDLHGGPAALVLAGLALSVSAPVTEEVFFRGVLYRALRNRLAVPAAATIAGVLFAAAHGLAYPPQTLPPRIVFGVVTCLLYERTGSLLPGMALHCIVDAGSFEPAISHHAYVATGFLALGAALLAYAVVRRLWDVRRIW